MKHAFRLDLNTVTLCGLVYGPHWPKGHGTAEEDEDGRLVEDPTCELCLMWFQAGNR